MKGNLTMETEQLAKVIEPERLDFDMEDLVLEEDISYAFESSRQKMDIFYPKEHCSPMPVVMWIHGGGWADEVLDKRYRPEVQLVHSF